MAATWLRNPATGFLVSADQIGAISAVEVGTVWAYTLYIDPTANYPFYQSVSTYPDALTAVLTAYELLIIELT